MISELRAELLTALSDIGTPAWATWPERFNPPGVLVVSARSGSYIGPGKYFGHFEVAMDVIVVVKRADSTDELTAIDGVIESILQSTVDAAWGFRGADAVGLINIQGAEYPATVLHLGKSEKLY